MGASVTKGYLWRLAFFKWPLTLPRKTISAIRNSEMRNLSHGATEVAQTQDRKALGQMGKKSFSSTCRTAKLSMEIQKVASSPREKKWNSVWQPGGQDQQVSQPKRYPSHAIQCSHGVGVAGPGRLNWTHSLKVKITETFTADSSILSFSSHNLHSQFHL